ncbi:hypothetical protein DCAR_0311673 [Daucus carota subsp. sativus]|uniref:Uncharacterized protein n=1 Tax=Daucus carota subsp. sativus TaxID=79200 RepID=A0A166AMT2_DAUCS|nr:PREDICTED: LRR receptor-like serine/threonine-protein kinase RCH1 isoform X1 [Daucus carota subsp. sativus]WOG92407.1 hypothetical protein DCAR_0311673 [Daucus carota subsp. sativus]
MSSRAITLLFLLLNISWYPASSGLNQEGLSLLSWSSSFNTSPSATFFSSWDPTDQNPCKWNFISCSSNGLVSDIIITSIDLSTNFPTQFLSFKNLTSLVLSNGNLTGEIPQSIGNLSSLVVLDLSFNALTGNIPHEIGSLSELQQLLLNSNSFEGEIPEEIGNCSKLKQLELFDNQLSGRIPEAIGQLSYLEIFRAGGNLGIHGEIPLQISNCRQLAFLGLADTGISGKIPYTLGELKNLKTLSIYTANLTGRIPPEIANCSALENLFLYQNHISGVIPIEMGFLKNLKRVLLWQNNLSGSIPGTFGNCSVLTVIDFSINSLTGELPQFHASLNALEEFLLSENKISGPIPPSFGNFSGLKHLELDNNHISGEIPPEIGKLKELSLFFAWQNQLNGIIPTELGNCVKLQALDLSHNFLTGSIPKSLFNLNNLTKLLLISNKLSGWLPVDIGNCTSLTRLRLGSNMLAGLIPSEIGLLQSLSYLELSKNQFTGAIPPQIGNCLELEMIDLHENKLEGLVPDSLDSLARLNVLDLSRNRLSGSIPDSLGRLASLNKLVLSENFITGLIPKSLGLCKDLQLLDVSSNKLIGSIPDEIGHLQELDILCNLSRNSLTGQIPDSFSYLLKLANLDLSHNMLTGSLKTLGNLDTLVSLNVSYNDFSGALPDTKFFHDLPDTVFLANQRLCTNRNNCQVSEIHHTRKCIKITTVIVLLSVLVGMTIFTIVIILFIRAHGTKMNDEESGLEWNLTPYQKLSFSVNDIVGKLSDSNIVGKGGSGIVYRVETPMQQYIAVKRLWPTKNGELPQRDLFSAEVTTLGSIRHKNIVRLLGSCSNGKSKMLLFDYISNGSLAGLLHESRLPLDWDARYQIILGAAHGLAYLHHDCFPPIVHRDIKANNILVGPHFEAFLADFGLAKLLSSPDCSRASNTIAGSYGYMAPEYGYSMRISEKSDVYSYGVVLLEVLTGMEPADRRIPEGGHIVSWVNHELKVKMREFNSILDQQLLLQSGTQIQEMLQVLGVAVLCVNPSPKERPTMKDVTMMLTELREETGDFEKQNAHSTGSVSNPRAAIQCSSFSRSSQPLIRSPPQ